MVHADAENRNAADLLPVPASEPAKADLGLQKVAAWLNSD